MCTRSKIHALISWTLQSGSKQHCLFNPMDTSVLYPEKGACADPVDEGAILGKGGPSPHSSDEERQLAPDIGRGKT
jgi:hypothetical protein